MSLKNEANTALQETRSIYKEYTSGMTRETLGREFHADSKRLKELYKEAIGNEYDETTGKPVSFMEKTHRLVSALSIRMNPVRRLIFGSSFVLFFLHYATDSGLIHTLAMPTAFVGLVMILLIELLEKLDVKKEIDLARDIQLGLLPSPDTTEAGFQFVSFANTANEVGGDYVDVIPTDKGVYYLIADVSGKGLSAALYMLRMQAMVHLMIRKWEPTPKELLLEMNEFIKSGEMDKTFVTACAAFFPTGADHVLMVRAGHNAPLLFNAKKDAVLDLKTTGFALGMTSTERLNLFMKESKIPMSKNDTLFFFTDGLNEARNEQGEEYGDTRLRDLIELYGSLEAKTIARKVQNSLEQFIGEEKPADDITFSVIKRV
jgi:sigma-B regulation protein RsbU (phosphoserine phosphatase)